MRRRLPVFFLIDVSESMAGEELDHVVDAMRSIVSSLRRDPYALETAFISLIAFAGKARTILPLTELIDYQQPDLPIGGGTGLGAALNHVMDEIDRQVIVSSPDRKGDWRPVVFLLTDGRPTDVTTQATERWNKRYRSRAHLIAVSFGGQADHRVLNQLTENVLVFLDTAPDAFGRFAQWVSLSIQAHSCNVRAGEDAGVNLSPMDHEVLTVADASNGSTLPTVDERVACLVCKCEKTKNPYLLKFVRDRADSTALDVRGGSEATFTFHSAVPLQQTYFELTADADAGARVSTSHLYGRCPCPCCGAEFSIAVCSQCQNIHCVGGRGMHQCPWCASRGVYDLVTHLNVNRGRG